MATDSIVAGLFTTPEMYQQQQQQAVQANALKQATLTPDQRAEYMLAAGAQGVGNALGGLMGAQDPMMQRQAQRRAFIQQVDMSNPESLVQAIRASSEDPELNAYLLGKYKEIETINKTKAEAVAKMREGNAAMLTTEQRNFIQARQDGYKGSFNDWLTQQNRSKATNLSVDAKGETAFAQELGKLDAKKVTDAVDARQGAIGLIKAVNELDKLDNAGLVSGSFATGRVGVANFLNTAGLASPEEAKKLANSQSYQKVAGDVILGNLGGKLGAGVSEGDRKFVEGLVPQLETSPDARRQLIQYMRTKGMDVIKESSRLENYARQNKGLSGYQPEIPLKAPEATPSQTPVVGGAGWSIKKVQ